MTQGRGGRRREYASDADRVRAWRQRQKEAARAERIEAATPTDPAAAVSTLAQAVPLLRQETEAALERLSEVAASITAATALLSDPAAVEAHLRRARADADKVRADAAAEIAALREQLDTAREERADADAAAAAADAETTAALAQLTEVRREHAESLAHLQQEFDRAAERHREQTVGLEDRIAALTAQVAEHRDRLSRAAAEKDTVAAAAADTARRLEAEIAAARSAAAAERDRAETVRADLEAARTEAATAHAQADAARERVDELRGELRELRAHPSGS
ncbi:hypothetical protein [Rhodococcus aetherivorans]